MLISKGGRDFAIDAIDNVNNCVPERVSRNLSVVRTCLSKLISRPRRSPPSSSSLSHRPIWSTCTSTRSLRPTPSTGSPRAWRRRKSPWFVLSRTRSPLSGAHAPLLQASATPTAPQLPPTTPTKTPLPPFDHAALPETPPVNPEAADRTVILKSSLPSPGLAAPPAPVVKAPAPAPAAAKGKDEDAFDALTKRFAELKKR